MDYEFKNFIFSILKLKTDNINLNLTHISINYDKAINTDSSTKQVPKIAHLLLMSLIAFEI